MRADFLKCRAGTIKEAGWNGSNYLYYAFIAHNNLADQAIKWPAYRITVRNAEGDLVCTDDYEGKLLLPGYDAWCVTPLIGPSIEGEKPATIEVEFIEGYSTQFVDVKTIENADALDPIVESTKLKTGYLDTSIVGEITNPNSFAIEKAYVVVIYRDEKGKMLSGALTVVNDIKAGKKAAFSVDISNSMATENYEVYASLWY